MPQFRAVAHSLRPQGILLYPQTLGLLGLLPRARGCVGLDSNQHYVSTAFHRGCSGL